jgi:hypothetical protein
MLVVGVHPLYHGLGMAPRAQGDLRGAALVSDVIESQSALAGARMGSAHGKPPQVLWCLTPAGPINTEHHTASEERASDGKASHHSKPPQTTDLKLDVV